MTTPLFLALATLLVGSLLAIVAIGTSLEEPRPDPPLDPGIGPRDERDNLLPTARLLYAASCGNSVSSSS